MIGGSGLLLVLFAVPLLVFVFDSVSSEAVEFDVADVTVGAFLVVVNDVDTVVDTLDVVTLEVAVDEDIVAEVVAAVAVVVALSDADVSDVFVFDFDATFTVVTLVGVILIRSDKGLWIN